ncbi:MAG TPA: DUF4230 domain-containing protein [Sphingobium sp.]|nr:DUF4230 domain-containing protein [Sphingobium sp.]
MTRKLIVPLLVGIMMFAAAFGGAFYVYRYREARAAGLTKDAATTALRSLQGQGRVTLFSARLAAVLTPARTEGEAGAGGPLMVLVPGTVRYDMDLRDASPRDIVWDVEEKTLAVKLPPLILSEPDIEIAGARLFEAGTWMALPNAGSWLTAGTRKAAQTQLLQQARDDLPMRNAREAGRKAVERAITERLREEGARATLIVRFADEPRNASEGGGKYGAEPEE